MMKKEYERIANQLLKKFGLDEIQLAIFENNQETAKGLTEITNRIVLEEHYKIFGLLYIDERFTLDRKPHFVINLEQVTPSLQRFRVEFLHEISNREAFKRWGKELLKFSEKAVLLRKIIKESSSGLKKNNKFLELYLREIVGYTEDAVKSIPADYITIEKGLSSELILRKTSKLLRWIERVRKAPTKEVALSKYRGLSYRIGYVSYLLFHPDQKRTEELKTQFFSQFKEFILIKDWYLTISEIVKIFQEIKIPPISEQMFKCYIESEKLVVKYLWNQFGGEIRQEMDEFIRYLEEILRKTIIFPGKENLWLF